MWHAGDGSNIKSWGGKWILNPSFFKAQSPVRILDREARVKELIDEDTGWWNEALVSEIFSIEEAEKICNLPISCNRQTNKLIWCGMSNENFSVKSAYHMGKNVAIHEEGECSRSAEYSEVWMNLWSLHVSKVVKIFHWKACNNLLPTKENLFERGMLNL